MDTSRYWMARWLWLLKVSFHLFPNFRISLNLRVPWKHPALRKTHKYGGYFSWFISLPGLMSEFSRLWLPKENTWRNDHLTRGCILVERTNGTRCGFLISSCLSLQCFPWLPSRPLLLFIGYILAFLPVSQQLFSYFTRLLRHSFCCYSFHLLIWRKEYHFQTILNWFLQFLFEQLLYLLIF